MKSTGILRRIDELGRIVIPKEIRRHLRIRDGESLEIFIDNNDIVLKKHSMMDTISSIAQKCVLSFNEQTKTNILIADRDKIIAASNSIKKNYLALNISEELGNLILERKPISYQNKGTINIIEGKPESDNYIAVPIIAHGDPVGLVLVLIKVDNEDKEAEKLAFFIADFLGKYLE